MSDPWARAVREAGEYAPSDLAEAVREELASLWDDLDLARRFALNRRYAGNDAWSGACEDVARRIVRLTRLSAVTPWEQIQTALMVDGVYQGILTAAGIDFAEPDMDQVRVLDAYIRHGGVPVPLATTPEA